MGVGFGKFIRYDFDLISFVQATKIFNYHDVFFPFKPLSFTMVTTHHDVLQ